MTKLARLLLSMLTISTIIIGCGSQKDDSPETKSTQEITGTTGSTSNVNRNITGSIESENDVDSFTFTAQSTGEVFLKWDDDTTPLRVSLHENNSQLTYDWSGLLSHSITKGHTYKIAVEYEGHIGEYTLNIVTTNDDRGDLTHQIDPNKSYSDTFNELNSSIAVYNFTANSTGKAKVKVDWVGDSSYLIAKVFQNGEYITNDYGSSSTLVDFDIIDGSLYSIVVYATDTNNVDLDYTIEVFTTNDLRGDAISTTPNTSYKSTLNSEANSLDVYNFTATSTGTARAGIRWIGDYYGYIYIYDNGQYISYDYGSNGASIDFNTISDHNYTVLVNMTDTKHSNLEYSFEISTKNDDRGEAVRIIPNSSHSIIMNETTNFYETYNYTATSTGVVTISTNWYGSSQYIYTYAYENGEYMKYDYGSEKNYLTIDTVKGKSYNFLVNVTDSDKSDLNVTLNIASCDDNNATIVSLNHDYNTTLNEDSIALKTYRFKPTSDVTATAKIEPLESSNYVYMYLYENGVYSTYDYGSSVASLTKDFKAGKVYTFVVQITDTNSADAAYKFSIK